MDSEWLLEAGGGIFLAARSWVCFFFVVSRSAILPCCIFLGVCKRKVWREIQAELVSRSLISPSLWPTQVNIREA